MVYPFESAAYATPLDSVSEPIRTKFGYHLLKITDIQDAMGVVQVAHIFVALRPDASSADSVRKAEKINNISAKIKEGMKFEDAVIQYSEDKGSARNGGQLSKFTCNRVVPEFVVAVDGLEIGDIALALEKDSINMHVTIKPGLYEKGDNKYVDQINWESGLSDEINSDVENLTVFVKVRKKLKPEPKKLDEARGLATADYQSYLEQEWIKQLKNKYPVSVNEEVLQKLIEKK